MTIFGEPRSFTWSPCGQSFSVLTPATIDIWDSLTLERCSSLQLTGPSGSHTYSNSSNLLTYSPDGHSLAGYDEFSGTITIWDIQTGGVVENIIDEAGNFLPTLLVWSSDGATIGAICQRGEETWDVLIYYIASGSVFVHMLPSISEPFLWSYNGSLQLMAMLCKEGGGIIVNIYKVGPALLDNLVETFSINYDAHQVIEGLISFSPTAYRMCITNSTLLVLNIQSSKILLQEDGPFHSGSLSSDGNLLAASGEGGITSIWTCSSNQGYTLWGKLPFLGGNFQKLGYQFSPASSLILISSSSYLEVQQLEGLTADPSLGYIFEEFSTDGTYLVTANNKGQTITITNLCKNSSRIIDVWFKIYGLALAGSILIVEGVGMVAAWKLTADGMVDEVLGARRADFIDSLWTRPVEGNPKFCIEGQIGVIWDPSQATHYDIESGEKLDVVLANAASSHSGKWICAWSYLPFKERYSLNYCHFTNHNDPSKDDTIPYYKEGWVRYPEGEHSHLFWLPVHWRPIWGGPDLESEWSEGYWLSDVMTLRLYTPFGLAFIKF